jgi:hypothetical protein
MVKGRPNDWSGSLVCSGGVRQFPAALYCSMTLAGTRPRFDSSIYVGPGPGPDGFEIQVASFAEKSSVLLVKWLMSFAVTELAVFGPYRTRVSPWSSLVRVTASFEPRGNRRSEE